MMRGEGRYGERRKALQINELQINEPQKNDSQREDSQMNNLQINEPKINDLQMKDAHIKDLQKNETKMNDSVIDYNKEKMDLVYTKVKQLIAIVGELENGFVGRKFTMDGRLVGSIGEVLAAYYYAYANMTLVRTDLLKRKN